MSDIVNRALSKYTTCKEHFDDLHNVISIMKIRFKLLALTETWVHENRTQSFSYLCIRHRSLRAPEFLQIVSVLWCSFVASKLFKQKYDRPQL